MQSNGALCVCCAFRGCQRVQYVCVCVLCHLHATMGLPGSQDAHLVAGWSERSSPGTEALGPRENGEGEPKALGRHGVLGEEGSTSGRGAGAVASSWTQVGVARRCQGHERPRTTGLDREDHPSGGTAAG
eukprot:GGOE01037079.1.p3 GENE.GGOE01037079.1~~GGOE01037079.1.p3  ORF type:complete len:130 (+),score=5.78 GGOE01037079.1:316-705(+)